MTDHAPTSADTRLLEAPRDTPHASNAREGAGFWPEFGNFNRCAESPDTLLDAREVAAWSGLSVASVYRCAVRLGGFRVGSGPRAPWRWRLGDLREAFDPFPGVGWLR